MAGPLIFFQSSNVSILKASRRDSELTWRRAGTGEGDSRKGSHRLSVHSNQQAVSVIGKNWGV